ncbi:MAG TPA: hypothetical protein VGR81_04815 [Candidatus Acidoferrales bacterium]|nr:hypothetical protein [Candidatus Acidoferrales bacterium]
MKIKIRRPILLSFFFCVISALFVSAAGAQQAPPQQPAPAASAPPPSQDQTSKSAQDRKKKQSEIEKETGTVNDRFFDAMPNYVVEDALKLPPLKTHEKFGLATASVLDPFTVPFVGFLAAVDQANNSPRSYGQGWGAYGERFGSEFGDNGIGTYMTVAIFPTILREDPRYYVMKKGRFGHRAFYSISRLFVTFTDSGNTSFNFSEIAGNAAATAASNIYHPSEDRTLSRNLGTWGMLIMWDGASNEMKEFWPDIRRKLFHKNTP